MSAGFATLENYEKLLVAAVAATFLLLTNATVMFRRRHDRRHECSNARPIIPLLLARRHFQSSDPIDGTRQ